MYDLYSSIRLGEKWLEIYMPAVTYMLKVINRNTRTMCEICLKSTIKTPERRHWRNCFFKEVLVSLEQKTQSRKALWEDLINYLSKRTYFQEDQSEEEVKKKSWVRRYLRDKYCSY